MRTGGRIGSAGAGLLAAVMLAIPGHAQDAACADHDTVAQRLAAGYGELRQSVALSSDNTLIEIFASPETGTWTMTLTRPGGPTCLIASGHAFERLIPVAPPRGEGA